MAVGVVVMAVGMLMYALPQFAVGVAMQWRCSFIFPRSFSPFLHLATSKLRSSGRSRGRKTTKVVDCAV